MSHHFAPPLRRLLSPSLLALLAAGAGAGGSGERAVLVADPSNAESLYVANVYAEARALPAPNVLHVTPGAPSFEAFAAVNREAFLGELGNRRLLDHVDYVVIPPGGSFYVNAPGLVSDGCFPVQRISIGSAYGLAWMADDVLGGLPSSTVNHFAKDSWDARFFDGSFTWFQGWPSVSAAGRRYFVGAMLGYTGPNGNTLQEVLDLVARSAAADASHPQGTFYFVETTDPLRSPPRDHAYPEAVARITALGGNAQHVFDWLPYGKHDCLGIMTGFAGVDVAGADLTIVDGAFCDHLTSFAGKFDTTSQTKMSEWVAKGASASAGTVEEPCNYSQKFPHARLHVLSFQGMALGEAWFRSQDWAPFQPLLYGDPLTAPFASPPAVNVPVPPAGPVSGVVPVAPTATATEPGAAVAGLQLLVDGVVAQTIEPGGAFALDTRDVSDGWHALRVSAWDDAPERNRGRWDGEVLVDNHGRSVSLAAAPAAGDLATRFDLTVAAAGGTAVEVRVLQGARVVAAAQADSAVVHVHGRNVGAGPVRLQAEALFDDGRVARSAPVALDVAYADGIPAGAAPVAYGFRRTAFDDRAFALELPGSHAEASGVQHVVVQPPAQAAVLGGSGPYRVLEPLPGAAGLDSLSFRIDGPGGSSSVETAVIEYVPGEPIPSGDFFELAEIAPAAVDALVPGTQKTVELHGSGFGQKTAVEVDGLPLPGLPAPYVFVNPSLIRLDMPLVGHLGPTTVTVRDGPYESSGTIEVVAPAEPRLQVASGEAGAPVFQAFGVDVVLAGTPGALHLLGVSGSGLPSTLPGFVDLAIGAGFSDLMVLGPFAIDPATAWTKLHFGLSGLPPVTTLHAQSVEIAPSLPLEASNPQEVLVVF